APIPAPLTRTLTARELTITSTRTVASSDATPSTILRGFVRPLTDRRTRRLPQVARKLLPAETRALNTITFFLPPSFHRRAVPLPGSQTSEIRSQLDSQWKALA